MGAADALDELEVDPERVQGWLADGAADVIDVREDAEREAGHIAGTRHVALVELAAQAFRASGFEAYSMLGGLARWAQEGRPLSPEGGYVADH